MAKVMTSDAFVKKALDIAKNKKTIYVLGCIGAPINTSNLARWTTNSDYAYNRSASRTAKIKAVCNTSPRTFGFDCCCLIKSILWGFSGNPNAVYGGAKYKSNGVPDWDETTMINNCSEVSTNFKKLTPGEAVWMPGHIGIYVGDGFAVECTPIWKDGVQITACNCDKNGYNRRNWTKHGKLPWVDYANASKDKPKNEKPAPITTFLPAKGYIGFGDNLPQVGKIAAFMYKCFPSYTSKKALGNYYGYYIQAAIKEFQRRTGLQADGCVGPLTLAELKKYGFKE